MRSSCCSCRASRAIRHLRLQFQSHPLGVHRPAVQRSSRRAFRCPAAIGLKRPRARIHFLPFRDTTERVAASTDGRTLAKSRLHDAVPRSLLGYSFAAWNAAQSCGSVHPPLGSFVTSISASASMLITLRFPTSRPVLRLSPRDVACRTCAKCRRHTESNLLVSPVVLGVGVVATPLTCSLQVGATRGHFARPKLPASPPVSMYNTNLLGRRAGYKRTTRPHLSEAVSASPAARSRCPNDWRLAIVPKRSSCSIIESNCRRVE